MIEILTLFLGLYHGGQPVELQVADEVAKVELLLNGELVRRLSGPPWSTSIDLGEGLQPHELIAIARDTRGLEVGRDRRWINREFEPPGETSKAARDTTTVVVIRLEPEQRLPPVSQMQGWLTADGQPLSVLRVEEGSAEFVIVMDPAARTFLDETARLFFEFLLEERRVWDPATVVDKQAFVATGRQKLLDRGEITAALHVGRVWERWNQVLSLGDDANVRFISPRAAPISRTARPMGVFNFTVEQKANEAGLLWNSVAVRPLQFRPRLSDAVAIAGLEAHASRGRRAVLLMMVDQAMGASRYSPTAVRSYLEDLQVPLYVWDFGLKDLRSRPLSGSDSDGREWGQVYDLSRLEVVDTDELAAWIERIQAAAEAVRQSLRLQRVVWLAGAHRPDRIELSDHAVGVHLAGSWRPAIIGGAQ